LGLQKYNFFVSKQTLDKNIFRSAALFPLSEGPKSAAKKGNNGLSYFIKDKGSFHNGRPNAPTGSSSI
jgi:hypothetical protein